MPELPGHSIAAAFAAEVTIPRENLWWLHEGNRAVSVGDWKLVAAKDDFWELYDLRSDRAEQVDLAASMPEKVKEPERIWQKQTDDFKQLVHKTLPDQAPSKR